MKSPLFTFILLSTFTAHAADQESNEWKLARRFTQDGVVVEQYRPADGPQELPLHMKVLAWLSSSKLCCCQRFCTRQVKRYKNSYIQVTKIHDDHTIESVQQYFHYK